MGEKRPENRKSEKRLPRLFSAALLPESSCLSQCPRKCPPKNTNTFLSNNFWSKMSSISRKKGGSRQMPTTESKAIWVIAQLLFFLVFWTTLQLGCQTQGQSAIINGLFVKQYLSLKALRVNYSRGPRACSLEVESPCDWLVAGRCKTHYGGAQPSSHSVYLYSL